MQTTEEPTTPSRGHIIRQAALYAVTGVVVTVARVYVVFR